MDESGPESKIKQRVELGVDLGITIVFSAFWLWFAYQYGFRNSPDSWYRGVLGKSIIEGHPYFINLKQGYLYEFGPWHHDATHEPFLPLLYAIFFKFFGNKIIVANIISSLSTGLLIYPLLRLSRKMLSSPLPALIIFALIVFNEKIKFLFEVTAGLSLPTTLFAFVSFLYFFSIIVENPQKRWIAGGVVSLFAYYLVRSAPQLIFYWTMFWTLLYSHLFLEKGSFARLRRLWGISFICVVPWTIRKLVIFKSPFATHMSAMLWKDRTYDYWDFHESMPLPTRESYFANHTLNDFLHKIFVFGPSNVYRRLNDFTPGEFWIYIVLFLIAFVAIMIMLKDRNKKIVFFTCLVVLIGYLGLFNFATIAHTRHYIVPFFTLVLTITALPFVMVKRFLHGWKFVTCSWLITLAMAIGVFHFQKDFWSNFSDRYLVYSYKTSDMNLQQDPLVEYLKKNIDIEDVIMAPVAQGQYLSFATGLTFIEMPANLKSLNEPEKFFQKYNIRYSLVDVRNILPDDMIEKIEHAGRGVLYTIGKGGTRKDFFVKLDRIRNIDVQELIAKGVKNKVVYFDAYHGAAPKDLTFFRKINLNAFAFNDALTANKEKLFQSGVYVLNYAKGQKELNREEHEILKEFIANGGRMLLMCPAWVWTSYEKKKLELLPYNIIAGNFELLLTSTYVGKPFRVVHPSFKVKGFDNLISGTFSEIIYRNANPIIMGGNDKVGAVAASVDEARIVLYGHNGLLASQTTETPAGLKFIQKTFEWLFANN